MIKKIPFFSGLLFISACVHGDVKLAHLFNNDMVIQRETEAPVWGLADAGESITVEGSWGKKTSTVANENGEWMVKLPTTKAGGPYNLTVSGKNQISLRNIMLGDVWLCTGQSNMAYDVGGIKDTAKDIETANYPDIRHYKASSTFSEAPASDNKGFWKVCSPKTVKNFSATGYFFAREIYKNQQIPIGLLSVNWGGTRIEPWTPPVGFDSVPELSEIAKKVDSINPLKKAGREAYRDYLESLSRWVVKTEQALDANKLPAMQPKRPNIGSGHQQATYLYNGMIHPIVPTAFKGVIWYQGESNGGEGISYYHKMQALISGWRQVFNQGDFPFYFVQLANFRKSDRKNAAGGDGWAKLRQAQLDSLKIKNTGMAVAIDIGEADDIHPRNKQDVGKRLALWALAKEYGKTDLVYSGPLYREMEIRRNKAIISFDHVGSGLMIATKTGESLPVESKNGKLTWFSIQDKDNQWHHADAIIQGNRIVVTSPNVNKPKAVRYAFTMNPEGFNLYNRNGLPASPFTTEISN